MANETISRVVGVFLGAALIIAGLAVFGSRTIAVHPEVSTSVAFRMVSIASDRPATAGAVQAN
jgi:hypothetical protein